jgi:hypothetical protein
MKASELRLGNFLQSDTNIIKIVGVVKKDIYYYHNKKNLYVLELNNLNFQPLELTEEWLLRMGFEKKENGLFTKKLEYIYNSIKYCEDYKIWIYYNDDNDAACNSIADLNFVHELQNLYFALTKKELTMK